jgi:hypothetical protein
MTMLQELLDEPEESLTEWERDTFRSMLDSLDSFQILTTKQRTIVEKAHARFHPVYENLVSDGKVPRGKEVLDPEALRHRPLKPPGRV